MRIATWNIHGARDASLERLAREIAAFEADVVCLNEVRRRHGRRLERLLGMRAYVASSFIGPYGNAIFTNEPIRRWRRFRFSGVRRVDRRDAAVAELSTGTTIAAIHLNAQRPDERIRNAKQLLETLSADAIIAGDLNEAPDAFVASEFATRFDDTGGVADVPTFPAAAPDARIDYVWVPRGARVRLCTVVPMEASDHRPVIVDLDGV